MEFFDFNNYKKSFEIDTGKDVKDNLELFLKYIQIHYLYEITWELEDSNKKLERLLKGMDDLRETIKDNK